MIKSIKLSLIFSLFILFSVNCYSQSGPVSGPSSATANGIPTFNTNKKLNNNTDTLSNHQLSINGTGPGSIQIFDSSSNTATIAAPSSISSSYTITLGTTSAAAIPVSYLDISGATEDTAPDYTADYAVTYDASASAKKKVLLKRLVPAEIGIAASDETTAITTGTAKVTFRMPHAMKLTAVRATLTTAQASGSIFTVDINESGTTVLSTKLTIDNTEKTSTTAATAAVISDSDLADDAEITIDVDQIGTSGATGLKIWLIGYRN